MTASVSPLDRVDIDDIAAILSVANVGDEEIHSVPSPAEATFTWDYSRDVDDQLDRLYEKAKTSQWNASTDLDWTIPVDQEQVVVASQAAMGGLIDFSDDLRGTPFESFSDDDWIRLGIESQNWTLSQFLHGEQGALICAAKLAEIAPDYRAKLNASIQTADEARHVEAFGRYLDTKLSGHYPINAHLGALLDDIVGNDEWDRVYLGMQILVEGLALAAFGFMAQMTTEPLLKSLLRQVMRDEARHVAFGVISLSDHYDQLSASEIRERQELAFEASIRMRDRFLQQEVWARMGVDPADALPLVLDNPQRALFQQMLFTKIVPNCKKLGLLDANDGWLRDRFTDIGVIQFEDLTDTSDEYLAYDTPAG